MHRERSFHSSLLRAMFLLAGGAIVVLAGAAVWFTGYLTKDFTATRVQRTLSQVEQRVQQLAQDAMRLNALTVRQVDADQPLTPQFEPLMTGLVNVFDLHRDISYLGVGTEASGEFAMLQRTPGADTTRLREYLLRPDGSRIIHDYGFREGRRHLLQSHPHDGYDPRARPFYTAAKTAACAVWTDSYAFWAGHENGEFPGITFAVPLFDSQGNLVGVIDVDFDLFDLSNFLAQLASHEEGRSFIIEERRDGNRVVVAHPDPHQVIDPQTRLFPTNSLAVSDPAARAVLAALPRLEETLKAGSFETQTVRAGGARYYWAGRRFAGPDMPRWLVVTVLPHAVVMRETLPVYLSLCIAATVLIGLSALLARRVTRHVAGPLSQLEAQIAGQSAQEEPAPVAVAGPKEFRRLAQAFNRLIEGIRQRRAELIESNRRLQAQVGQRQQAERALRDSQEYFQKAFSNSPDAIVISRRSDGRYLEVNDGFTRLLGYSREEALRSTSTELVYADAADRAEALEALRQSGQLRDYEVRVKCKDGSVRLVSLSMEAAMVQGEDCLIGTLRDITEQKKTAAELKQHRDRLSELVQERTAELGRINMVLATEVQERKRVGAELLEANERLKELDRLKSEFLAMMSHELRTPLNSIIGFTGILRQRLAGPLTAEQEKQLGMVQGSARHLLGLINDLLDLSRIESGRMELHTSHFKVADVIQEVVKTLEPMAAMKGLPLRAELSDPGFELHSDRKKVFQVLLNLVNNAVKFTERGEVRIVVESDAASVRFAVRDTGIGIKPEHMALLFEAFRQVDGSARRVYEGTGLGLYLCRKLVGLLGGEISAKSEFGKGSEFCFTVLATREELSKT